MTKWACFLATVVVAMGLAVVSGAAEVYVWVDANGVEHWSDRPPQPSKTGAKPVKVVSPSFRNSSVPEVPWQKEPELPEPPPTRGQQTGKDQPANEASSSTATDPTEKETTDKEISQAPADDSPEAKPAQTREERLAEGLEKREAAMRRRVTGEAAPRQEVPKQAEPEVPKPANLDTNTSGYSTTWGL